MPITIGSDQTTRTLLAAEAMQKMLSQPTVHPYYLRQIRIRATQSRALAMERIMPIQADTDETLRIAVLQQRRRLRVRNEEECRVDSSLHQLRPKVTM